MSHSNRTQQIEPVSRNRLLLRNPLTFEKKLLNSHYNTQCIKLQNTTTHCKIFTDENTGMSVHATHTAHTMSILMDDGAPPGVSRNGDRNCNTSCVLCWCPVCCWACIESLAAARPCWHRPVCTWAWALCWIRSYD